MNTYPLFRKMVILSKNDLRNIFRDKSIWMPMLAPFLILFLLREGVPVLEQVYPAAAAYRIPILAMMTCINAIFPAFFISFIMLDEKDHNLFAVMRVMPLAPHWFILYRVFFIALLGFVYVFITIAFSGLTSLSFIRTLALSLLVSLLAPLATLIVVTFAKNKIEGITMLKGVNMALALPLVAFFTDSIWAKFLGFVPVHWIYQAYAQTPDFWLNIVVGILYHVVLIGAIFRRFRGRVFR